MQNYGYMKFASKVFVVVGWILVVLSVVALVAGIVFGVFAGVLPARAGYPGPVLGFGGFGLAAGLGFGLLYALMFFVWGVMLLASGQAFSWMRDMEEHAAGIRSAYQRPPGEPPSPTQAP